MAYFKCKGDSKPKKLLVADWDFNKGAGDSPWIDEVNGYALDYDYTYNYTAEGDPPTIFRAWIQRESSTKMHYLKLPGSLVYNPNEHDCIEYIININGLTGTYNLSATYYRFFVFSDNFGSSSDKYLGLLWRTTSYSDGNWYLYNPLSDTYAYISDDENFFKKSIVTVEIKKIDSSTALMTVYKNETEVISMSIPVATLATYSNISIGSHRNTMAATINSLKVKVE